MGQRERRLYQRHNLNFPVTLSLRELGQEPLTFEAEAQRLAYNTLEVESEAALVEQLRRQERVPQQCRLHCELPGAAGSLTVDCLVMLYRRLSQRRYRLVLEFEDFSEDGRDRLDDYLSSLI